MEKYLKRPAIKDYEESSPSSNKSTKTSSNNKEPKTSQFTPRLKKQKHKKWTKDFNHRSGHESRMEWYMKLFARPAKMHHHQCYLI